MQKSLIILITVLTLSVTGLLYGSHGQTGNEGTVTLEEAYTSQFPGQMPDLVLDPMANFPLY